MSSTDKINSIEAESKRRSSAKKMEGNSEKCDGRINAENTAEKCGNKPTKECGSEPETEATENPKRNSSDTRLEVSDNMEAKIKSDGKTRVDRAIKMERRFEKSRSNSFRSDEKDSDEPEFRSDREMSPEIKDDISEHSESSKVAEDKLDERDRLRIPFSGAPLGTGPGRGVPFGAAAGRNPHFPHPVFMWCPTIGLPPWCPALFPPGLVS